MKTKKLNLNTTWKKVKSQTSFGEKLITVLPDSTKLKDIPLHVVWLTLKATRKMGDGRQVDPNEVWRCIHTGEGAVKVISSGWMVTP